MDVAKAEEEGVGWVEGRGQEVKNALADGRRSKKRPQTVAAVGFLLDIGGRRIVGDLLVGVWRWWWWWWC